MRTSSVTGTIGTLHRSERTWLAYGLVGYYSFFLNVLGPVLPLLQREQRGTYLLSSLHASALALGMLVASLVGPALVVRLGRRLVLWVGSMGLALAGLLLVSSVHPASTLLSAGALGVFSTLLLGVVPAMLADEHPAHRAAVLSEATVGGSLSATLAPVLVGLSAEWGLGWRGGVVAGVASVLLLAYGLTQLPAEPRTSPTSSPARTSGRPLPRVYWAYWVGLVLVVGIEFALIFWSAGLLIAAHGWAAPAAATASGLFVLLMAVGRLAGARLALRVSDRMILLGSLLLALMGVLIFWRGVLPGGPLLGLALAGFGIANLYPLTLARAVGTAPRQSDLASGRASLASAVAVLSAPFLLGTLADRIGLTNSFLLLPMLILAALAMIGGTMAAQAQQRAGVHDESGITHNTAE